MVFDLKPNRDHCLAEGGNQGTEHQGGRDYLVYGSFLFLLGSPHLPDIGNSFFFSENNNWEFLVNENKS